MEFDLQRVLVEVPTQILSVWKNNALLEGPIDLPPVFDDFQIRLARVQLAPGDYIFLRLSADEAGTDWGSDVVDFDFSVSTRPIQFNPEPVSDGPGSKTGIPVIPPIGLGILSLLLLTIGLKFIERR